MNIIKKFNPFLIGIILIHLFILSKLTFFPYPEFFIFPYLVNNGLTPYVQIIDQHFPGLMLLPINFFTLGMDTPEVARIWLLVIIAITQVLIFLVGKEIFKSKYIALGANLFYLLWQPFFNGSTFWIESFLPLLLLPSFLFVYKFLLTEKIKYLFLTGLFLSLGLLFKQTVLPLVLLVGLFFIIYLKDRFKLAYYLLGFLPVFMVLGLYLLTQGILANFLYWTIIFNLTIYSNQAALFPGRGELERVVLIFGFGLIALLFEKKRLIFLLIIFIISLSMGAFGRFDYFHLQSALPFVAIASVTTMQFLLKVNLGSISILFYILVSLWWQHNFYSWNISNKIFFFDQSTYKIANKIKDYSTEGEEIFIFGAQPHLYYLSNTLPSGKYFVYILPWYMGGLEEDVLLKIKQNPPNLVVADFSANIDQKVITGYAPRITDYLKENYTLLEVYEGVEFRKRND